MSVTVRFFASLREQVGAGQLDIETPAANARELWSQATALPLDPHVRVAINQAYADVDAPIADGDEVAFFPPVTGG